MIKLSIEIKKLEEIEGLAPGRLNGLFTPEELSGSNGITLAGKLAAKTAFLRNAGISRSCEHYKKVEIGKSLSGRPFVKVLDNPLCAKISDFKTSVSISHTKDTAIAVCVLYNDNAPNPPFSPGGRGLR